MNADRIGVRTTFPGLWLLVWPVLRCLLPSAAQVLAGGTLFPQVVVDPFPLDRQLHLRQRGHGGSGRSATANTQIWATSTSLPLTPHQSPDVEVAAFSRPLRTHLTDHFGSAPPIPTSLGRSGQDVHLRSKIA